MPPFVAVEFNVFACGLVLFAWGKAWPLRVWRPSVGGTITFPRTSDWPSIKASVPRRFYLNSPNFELPSSLPLVTGLLPGRELALALHYAFLLRSSVVVEAFFCPYSPLSVSLVLLSAPVRFFQLWRIYACFPILSTRPLLDIVWFGVTDTSYRGRNCIGSAWLFPFHSYFAARCI